MGLTIQWETRRMKAALSTNSTRMLIPSMLRQRYASRGWFEQDNIWLTSQLGSHLHTCAADRCQEADACLVYTLFPSKHILLFSSCSYLGAADALPGLSPRDQFTLSSCPRSCASSTPSINDLKPDAAGGLETSKNDTLDPDGPLCEESEGSGSEYEDSGEGMGVDESEEEQMGMTQVHCNYSVPAKVCLIQHHALEYLYKSAPYSSGNNHKDWSLRAKA